VSDVKARHDDLDEMRLDDRTAIVTGAARGMGRAIAQLLGNRGASVVMVDVLEDRLKNAVDELRSGGIQALAVHGSVADANTAQRAVGAAIDSWGRLDILVNNAAVGGRHAPLWELTDEDFDEVIAVNAKGTFNFLRASVPPMIERKWGRIVNIASTAAKDGIANTSHYASSKAAVLAMTKALGKEVASMGILVNAITPGGFDTEIRNRPGADPNLLKGSLARVPLGRLGQPEEVARMVGFLVSPQLTFSTSAVFDISGGYSSY
jgi:NAD(P)-dependent dehydrogenase (short-subunit alcohol dehydrogenase family)